MKGGLLFTLFIFFVTSGIAQAQTSDNPVTNKYSYSFTGDATQQQLDKLEAGMYNISGVVQVKIVFKNDTKAGLLTFTFSEYKKAGEQDNGLNAADVKRLIADSGLVPNEFKEL
ncbi:MAG: hypothetical protein A2W93_03700 [Bacteroidetes bacterium GWF2_43_63]|nr:MAG: hypothetical protein A2W93_03700 [Bacteroidetes bacterium GWF2_43_63]HBG70533.1 hypothetical protein [Bacteroidales bacterium]HCB61528.1 hypothetical protein [Bacteroidales bacterium]